jgi:hypothetical protein
MIAERFAEEDGTILIGTLVGRRAQSAMALLRFDSS